MFFRYKKRVHILNYVKKAYELDKKQWISVNIRPQNKNYVYTKFDFILSVIKLNTKNLTF